ncbi:MAG: hypothetical protein U0R29_00515 [Solirubrobacterales bacterium]
MPALVFGTAFMAAVDIGDMVRPMPAPRITKLGRMSEKVEPSLICEKR